MTQIKHSDVMDVALNTYLGSEERWCTGSYAKSEDGADVDLGSSHAFSHCAEGAIRAAVIRLARSNNYEGEVYKDIRDVKVGVDTVLREEYPEITKYLSLSVGTTIPAFNDGLIIDSLAGLKQPGVGYQGIRNAFEKYRSKCLEEDK